MVKKAETPNLGYFAKWSRTSLTQPQ